MNDEKSRGARKEGVKADSEMSRNYQSGSFLVRFWVEPSEGEGEPVLRGCIKNLKTGQEHYVDDPGKVGDLVRGHLQDRERSKEASKETKTGGKGERQAWVEQH